MRVLVSGHGYERPPLDAARRTAPYDKLVLLTTRPEGQELAELIENETLAGIKVETHAVDPDDLTATLATANRVIDAEKKGSVKVHVAGGPNLVTSALLLASFQRGVTAFFCHERGTSYLPVIQAAAFQERFDDAQRHVLLTLTTKGGHKHEELVTLTSTLSNIRTALRVLKKAGLVHADATTASLTPTGDYYRAHLASLKKRK